MLVKEMILDINVLDPRVLNPIIIHTLNSSTNFGTKIITEFEKVLSYMK